MYVTYIVASHKSSSMTDNTMQVVQDTIDHDRLC